MKNCQDVFVGVQQVAVQVPSGNRHLEHVCGLCREQPMLKPLVVEALRHAPFAVLVDPDAAMLRRSFTSITTGRARPQVSEARPLAGDSADSALSLRLVRNVNGGVPQFCASLFSDMKHFHAFMPDALRHCFVPECGRDTLTQLAELGLPLVVDPGSRHSLYLSADEYQPWLAACCGCDASSTVIEGWVSLCKVRAPSSLLLDRVSAFFAGLDEVERAYLCRTVPDEQMGVVGPACDGDLALLVECPDEAAVGRVRSALPLLGWGLPTEQSPCKMLSMSACEHLAPDVAALVTPVYDRAMGLWLRR